MKIGLPGFGKRDNGNKKKMYLND